MLVPRKPGTTKRLTKASVDALSAHDGTADLFDTEIRGFHVRAWPAVSGGKVRKVFRLKYFMHGRQRVITLGEYGPKGDLRLQSRTLIGGRSPYVRYQGAGGCLHSESHRVTVTARRRVSETNTNSCGTRKFHI